MTTTDHADVPRESSVATHDVSSTDSSSTNKRARTSTTRDNAAAASAALAASFAGAPTCPKCSGRMWDNRLTKRNMRAPDFKCRDPRCDGVLWPGEHKTPAPIIRPHASEPNDAPAADEPTAPVSTPADADEHHGTAEQEAAAALQAKTEQQQAARAALRQCYLDVTDFVLAEVRPKYQDAGVPLGDSTVAAIAATLFIQMCKPRWEGGT
jgi:hypothetical protein